MKTLKLLSGMMAAAMSVVAMGAAMSATAAETVQVTIGKDTKAAGENFSVNVDLASVPSTGLSSIDFAISYDASIIDVTDVTLGTIGNTGAASQEGEYGDTLFDWYDTGSQIVIIWATGLTDSNYWVKSNGTFLTISGTVDSGAAAGSVCTLDGVAVDRAAYPGGSANTDILFSAVGETATVDYQAVFTAGSVTVDGGSSGTVVWGDADCNEQLQLADAILLAKANAGIVELSAQGKVNCDVYADGKTDSTDLNYVLQLLTNKKSQADMPIIP